MLGFTPPAIRIIKYAIQKKCEGGISQLPNTAHP